MNLGDVVVVVGPWKVEAEEELPDERSDECCFVRSTWNALEENEL